MRAPSTPFASLDFVTPRRGGRPWATWRRALPRLAASPDIVAATLGAALALAACESDVGAPGGDASGASACTDADRDGYGSGPGCRGFDCDDANRAVHSGASEDCDLVDNDCDGALDEGCPCEPGESIPCGSEVGECTPGTQSCVSGVRTDCVGALAPAVETCDGLDNDCDGAVDNGVTNACGACGAAPVELCNGADEDCDGASDEDWPELGSPCDGPADADLCASGTWQCAADGTGIACVGESPAFEGCNGVDDDCDGLVDEDWPELGTPCDGTDSDTCPNGRWACAADGRGATCDADAAREEVCNGVDDDCDGVVDRKLVSSAVSLGDATWISAFEASADGRAVLVTRGEGRATVLRGNLGAGLTVAATRELPGYASVLDAKIVGGHVAVAFGEPEAGGVTTRSVSVWYGEPAEMVERGVPLEAFEIVDPDIRGAVVGLDGATPAVLVAGETSGSVSWGEDVIEVVAYTYAGATFVGSQLWKHAYIGGNLFYGSLTRTAGGALVGLVTDEWNNNYWEGIDERVRWVRRVGGSWSLGAEAYDASPTGDVAAGAGGVYGLTRPWGAGSGEPATLYRTSDGASPSVVATADALERATLVDNAAGRVLLVYQELGAAVGTPSRVADLAAPSVPGRTLEMPLAASDGYVLDMDGDWLLAVRYRREGGWSDPVTDATFERELVCP